MFLSTDDDDDGDGKLKHDGDVLGVTELKIFR